MRQQCQDMSHLQKVMQSHQDVQGVRTHRHPAAISAVMTSCVVHLVSGKTLSFNIASVATVWHLKRMIKIAIDVPKRQQRLFDGIRELSSHSPISCAGGSHQLTLIIVDTTCHVCNAETSTPRVYGGCYYVLLLFGSVPARRLAATQRRVCSALGILVKKSTI